MRWLRNKGSNRLPFKIGGYEMAERKAISKKMRFEVLKRDAFTCQYCGAKAPDVILHIDHLIPVKEGGKNTMLNLITACQSCNSGKSARMLDDNSVVSKQRTQLEELSEKREQMKLMLKWKEELETLSQEQMDVIDSFYEDRMNCSLTEHGHKNFRTAIKKYGFNEVYESLNISFNQYFEDAEDIEKVHNYTFRICANRSKTEANPMFSKQMYVRAILKNRGMLYNDFETRKMLEECVHDEQTFEEVSEYAKTAKNWTEFKRMVNDAFCSEY